MDEATKTRFWAKVRRGPDCWEWQAGMAKDDYGGFKWKGRWLPAQRVAWLLTYGPIPQGLCVLHSCDNPLCVRPAHLMLGTKTANARDRDRKGRGIKGTRAGSSKLTTEKGDSYVALARLHGVSPQAIGNIARNRSWRHVA